MKNKFTIFAVCLLTAFSVITYSFPALAEEDIGELKKQIEALQKRVGELESEKNESQQSQEEDFFGGRHQRAWDPFYEMQQMQEEMDRMFQNSNRRRGGVRSGLFSNDMSFDYDFDMKETKEGYEIVFDMKGFDKEKVDIQINESSVTVKGEHKREEKEENQNGFYSSQSFGTFIKTIPLPIDADTTKVKTEKDGDRLIIKMPKKS